MSTGVLETCRKLEEIYTGEKKIASSWLFSRTEPRCTVNKTQNVMYVKGRSWVNKTTNQVTNCQNVMPFVPFTKHIIRTPSCIRFLNSTYNMGRDSSVGIATRYGPDGAASNPGGGETFRTQLYHTWGPTSLLYDVNRVSFPG